MIVEELGHTHYAASDPGEWRGFDLTSFSPSADVLITQIRFEGPESD